MQRREFLQRCSGTAIASAVLGAVAGAEPTHRRMTMALSCGAIGVKADQASAIELGQRHGFESVEPYAEPIASLEPEAMTRLKEDLRTRGLTFAAAGLPVDFRGETERFRADLDKLPRAAAGWHRAGVTRVGTWISPTHRALTYVQNFRQHASRLREVAKVLGDHGLRLGLEYVGTQSARAGARNPFVHSLAETRELIAEINTGNVGLVLDSWHWWQADDSVADLAQLRNSDVVAVDLNDAPAGVAKDQQRDGKRELPAATGVIDVAAFLGALRDIGYDGPVRAEPFNAALNDLDNEPACAATIAALRRAFAALK